MQRRNRERGAEKGRVSRDEWAVAQSRAVSQVRTIVDVPGASASSSPQAGSASPRDRTGERDRERERERDGRSDRRVRLVEPR